MKNYKLKVFVVDSKDFDDCASLYLVNLSIASDKLQKADIVICKNEKGYKILKDRLGLFNKGELK